MKPRRLHPSMRPASAPPSAPPPGFDVDEGSPTVAKRDSAVQAVRRLVSVEVPRLTLTVERERGVETGGRRVIHDGEACRIGTHSSNDLVITDPAVSRFHCRIVREGGVFHLKDAGSLNGTLLDGVRVRDADLHAGARIQVGDSLLRIEVADRGGEDTVASQTSFGQLVGASVAMRRLFGLLERVANSEAHVLISGESGTGKELVAAEIVQRGARADRPFVLVDCGAISPSLVESELFGHVRGAFTGADRDRVGAFEAANGGTVFLDEIGELPLEVQPKLLRALEAKEIRRVGETRQRKVDVRVIAATHRDLAREVNRGRFREDLYFRLAVIGVEVPPLRERLDDLPLLVTTFLTALRVPERGALFSAEVLADLAQHDWPGNVRELRNYVERSIVLETASPAHRSTPAPAPRTKADVSVPFKVAKDALVDSFERTYLIALLEAAEGNMSRAARLADIDRMYLHRLVQKHGLR